jgi:transcription initiation factor TFIID subunit 5
MTTNETDSNGNVDITPPAKAKKKGKKKQEETKDLLKTFKTKRTPVFTVRFTRRNLLLAAGPFLGGGDI